MSETSDYEEAMCPVLGCQRKLSPSYKFNRNFQLCYHHNNKRTKYKMTVDDFIELHLWRDCMICGNDDTDKLVIDHDHITGKVRGLICPSCNTMLGFAKDSISTLTNAISYLEKNND